MYWQCQIDKRVNNSLIFILHKVIACLCGTLKEPLGKQYNIKVKIKDFGARIPGFKYQFHHQLVVRP